MHRNKVYGHPEWAKHKSSWKNSRQLFSILDSCVISAFGPLVLACILLAIFVIIFKHFVKEQRIPRWFSILEGSFLPFTLTSSVLSRLLVFQTNYAYNRFVETRMIWDSNMNRTRDLAHKALTWIRNYADAFKLSCFLSHIKAYPFCLKDNLTEGFTSREEHYGTVQPHELEAVMSAGQRPNYVLQVVFELIDQCSNSEWAKMAVDDNITIFHDNAGARERILKTPIPVAHTRVTSRFLILWHLASPFALSRNCWLTIPESILTATMLFYIEEVGVLIEEPFWMLHVASMN